MRVNNVFKRLLSGENGDAIHKMRLSTDMTDSQSRRTTAAEKVAAHGVASVVFSNGERGAALDVRANGPRRMVGEHSDVCFLSRD